MPEKSKEIVNVPPAHVTVPDEAIITPIQKVSGANVAKVNLRDHPEMDGMRVIVMSARLNADGNAEFGGKPYAVAQAFIFPAARKATAEDLRVLVTGAGNLYDRLADCVQTNAFPVSGILRKSGRAWFLD